MRYPQGAAAKTSQQRCAAGASALTGSAMRPAGARPQSTPQAQEPQSPKHQPGTHRCMQMHMQPATEAAPLVTCCVNRHDGDIRIEAGGKNSTREGTTPNESDTCKTNEKKNETRCWKWIMTRKEEGDASASEQAIEHCRVHRRETLPETTTVVKNSKEQNTMAGDDSRGRIRNQPRIDRSACKVNQMHRNHLHLSMQIYSRW